MTSLTRSQNLPPSSTSVPPGLDHIVLATPHLDATVERFAELTGVEPAFGGRHASGGTANYLVSFGSDRYLEIIGLAGPGADADPRRPAEPPFGLGELSVPRVVTWAIHVDDLDAAVAEARAAGYDPGDAWELARTTPAGERLEWRLTPALREASGVVPFLIGWGGARHPSSAPGVPELELVALHAEVGDGHATASAGRSLAALDAGLEVRAAAPAEAPASLVFDVIARDGAPRSFTPTLVATL